MKTLDYHKTEVFALNKFRPELYKSQVARSGELRIGVHNIVMQQSDIGKTY
jgi:hypothetical protein